MTKWTAGPLLLLALMALSQSMEGASGCVVQLVPEFVQKKINEVKTKVKIVTSKITGIFTGVKTVPLHKGCFLDSREQADLAVFAGHSDDMTVQRCISRCVQWKKKFAGVQEGRACHCGNSFGSFGEAKGLCKIPCAGNRDEVCGGKLMNSVYEIPK